MFALTFVVLAALVVAAPAAPAASVTVRNDTCAGANQGLAGWLMCSNYHPVRMPAPNEEASTVVDGRTSVQCEFAGTPTAQNTLVVSFSGSAHSTGDESQTTPLITVVTCEINNLSAGGTNSQSVDFGLNGPNSAAASSTLLATDGPTEWPLLDVTICLSAYAVYGPTPVRVSTVPRTCMTPNG